MKNKLNNFFAGRQGMDELSKALFWSGLIFLVVSILLSGFLAGIPASILRFLSIFMLIYCFIRAFSRRRAQRDAENYAYLNYLARRKHSFEAFKDRRRQSRDFKFFKCPGCGAMLRVPRGKGKVHITCKCGYTLYRKT